MIEAGVDVSFESALRYLTETVVVFEDVYNDGIKVGSHADIDDISQSIYVPGIKTTATSEAEGSKKIDPVGNVVITDVIHTTTTLFRGLHIPLRDALSINRPAKR